MTPHTEPPLPGQPLDPPPTAQKTVAPSTCKRPAPVSDPALGPRQTVSNEGCACRPLPAAWEPSTAETVQAVPAAVVLAAKAGYPYPLCPWSSLKHHVLASCPSHSYPPQVTPRPCWSQDWSGWLSELTQRSSLLECHLKIHISDLPRPHHLAQACLLVFCCMLLSPWPQLSLNTVPPHSTPTHTCCLFPWTLLGTLSQTPPVNPNSCLLSNLHFLYILLPQAFVLLGVAPGTSTLKPVPLSPSAPLPPMSYSPL